MSANPDPNQIHISVKSRDLVILEYLPYLSYYEAVTTPHDQGEQDPDHKKPIVGVVFFAPAMAVRQGYYRYFLDFFSNQGYLVYSFDFSGIDLSRNQEIKESEITIHDWIDDLQSTVDWVLENYSDRVDLGSYTLPDDMSFYYLCHSLGGQLFGFLENQNAFPKFVAVTSQNGYWRFYKNKWRYFFFWYFIQPLSTKLYGYFPSKRLGFGENLPTNVISKWKQWCTSRNYFFDDPDFEPSYELYSGEMLTLSFEDDPWATPEAIDDLYGHYTNATRKHLHVDPNTVGIDEIGHMGYFRPNSQKLWHECLAWLEQ